MKFGKTEITYRKLLSKALKSEAQDLPFMPIPKLIKKKSIKITIPPAPKAATYLSLCIFLTNKAQLYKIPNKATTNHSFK